MGLRVKITERIVMVETGTYVVQSMRRVPEEQRYDHRLGRRFDRFACSDADHPTMPDVEPAPTHTYHSDNWEPATSTSAKWILKDLVTWQDVQPAKFTALDHKCLDKNTLRNAENDSKTR